MKTLILTFFLTVTAQASQIECTEGLKAFNKKHAPNSKFVFIDFKSGGSPVFLRHKVGLAEDRAKTAEAMGLVRLCIKAGFPNMVFTGDLGNDTPKRMCQIVNFNTMGAVCNEFKDKNKINLFEVP